MQKATTLREIYNTFKPEEFLTKEKKEFYVDVFAEDMQYFSDKFDWSENDEETLFLAGQPGNGKSTALRLLPHKHPSIAEKYSIVYLDGREKFDPNKPVDAIDIVLMVGFLFANKTSALRDEYIKKLEEFKSEKLGEFQKIEEDSSIELKQEATSMDSGFKIDLHFLKIGTDFEDNFRLDSQTKNTTRKLLKLKKKDFLDATNEIIKKYTHTLNGKKLLLIIDDIEKLRDSDHVFTDDIGTLLQLQCAKIITMPIHLKRKHAYAGQPAIELSIKLKEKSKDRCINKNLDSLEKIIDNRIDLNSNLISKDAKRKIVLMSGGNIRQLIILTRESALKAKNSDSISLGDVESVIFNLRKQYSSATQRMETFLEEINKNHKPEDYGDENLKLLAIATREQMIFGYHNGDTWYDVNPIILDKEPCRPT